MVGKMIITTSGATVKFSISSPHRRTDNIAAKLQQEKEYISLYACKLFTTARNLCQGPLSSTTTGLKLQNTLLINDV